jgi:hypothetical protein
MTVKMPKIGRVVDYAKITLKFLKEKHPDLRCYLVFHLVLGKED